MILITHIKERRLPVLCYNVQFSFSIFHWLQSVTSVVHFETCGFLLGRRFIHIKGLLSIYKHKTNKLPNRYTYIRSRMKKRQGQHLSCPRRLGPRTHSQIPVGRLPLTGQVSPTKLILRTLEQI